MGGRVNPESEPQRPNDGQGKGRSRKRLTGLPLQGSPLVQRLLRIGKRREAAEEKLEGRLGGEDTESHT